MSMIDTTVHAVAQSAPSSPLSVYALDYVVSKDTIIASRNLEGSLTKVPRPELFGDRHCASVTALCKQCSRGSRCSSS